MHTDPAGGYGTLLKFHDPELGARSFRQADDIPPIENCRIQLVATGVKDD